MENPYQELASTVCPCCGQVSDQWIGPVRLYEHVLHLPCAVCYDCDPDRLIRYRQTCPGKVNADYLRRGLYRARKAGES
jgi:hypothetical protein